MQTNRTIVFNNVRESKIELALRWKNYPKNLHKKIKVSLSLWLIYKRVAFYVLLYACVFVQCVSFIGFGIFNWI